VTPFLGALRERQAECAIWLRNGAVPLLSARMTASPTGLDVQLDQRLLHALIEARDDGVLAALVYEIGVACGRFPDCLLQALVERSDPRLSRCTATSSMNARFRRLPACSSLST
jgi:hypothetical protein